MNIFRTIWVSCLILLSVKLSAQGDAPAPQEIDRNTVFLELAGHGGLYSLNYDRLVLVRERYKVAVAAGVNYFQDNSRRITSYPVNLNFLLGKRHHAAISVGYLTNIRYRPRELKFPLMIYDIWGYPSFSAGYRYQRPAGGFFWGLSVIRNIFPERYASYYGDYSQYKTTLGVRIGFTW